MFDKRSLSELFTLFLFVIPSILIDTLSQNTLNKTQNHPFSVTNFRCCNIMKKGGKFKFIGGLYR